MPIEISKDAWARAARQAGGANPDTLLPGPAHVVPGTTQTLPHPLQYEEGVSPKSRQYARMNRKQIRKLENRIRLYGEEPPNTDTGSRLSFWTVLEQLQRPQSAVFNTLLALQDGITPQEAISAFWKGLTFEEKATGIDLLDAMGWDTDQFVTKALAFTTDVVVDPLNVVSGAGVLRLIKMGANTTRKVRLVRELGELAGESRTLQALRRGFTNKTGNELFDRIARSNMDFENFAKAELGGKVHQWEFSHGKRLGPALSEKVPVLAEFLDKRPDEYARRLDALGRDANRVDAAVRDFNRIIKDARDAEAASGVAQPALGSQIQKSLLKLDKERKQKAIKEISRVARQAQVEVGRLERKRARLLVQIPKKISDRFLSFKRTQLPTERVVTKTRIAAESRLNQEGINLVTKTTEREIRQVERQLNELEKMGRFLHAPGAKKSLRLGLRRFAEGSVSEEGLYRFLDEVLKGTQVRHLPGIVNQISRRRQALMRLVEIQDNIPALVRESTDMLVRGVYKVDELLEIMGSEAPGLAKHIRDVGKRVSEVQKALPDVDDIPAYAQEIVDEFMKGNFTRKEVIDLLGKPVKGATVGETTLSGALATLKRTQSAIDNLTQKVVPKRIQRIEDMLDRRFGQKMIELEELMANVPNYVPHVMTREGLEGLVRRGRGFGSRLHSDKHASLIMRRFTEKGVPLTLEEVEAIVAKGELASLAGKPLFKQRTVWDVVMNRPLQAARLFSTKPSAILATRGLRATKAIAGAKFLDEVAENFGRRLGKGEKIIAGEAFSTHPRLRGIAFSEKLVPEIDRVFTSAFGSDESVNAVRQVFRSMLNYWKTWTLAIFPAYHFRNAIGNLWNMHLSGMFPITNPKDGLEDMVRALEIQRRGAVNNVEALSRIKVRLRGGADIDGNGIIKAFKRHGIINEGFYAVDIEKGLGTRPGDNLLGFYQRSREDMGEFLRRAVGQSDEGRFSQSLLGAEGALTQAGLLAGKAVENNARMALALFHIRKGKTIEEAAEIVRKFLFDYQELTSFERGLKEIFPFYTWTRKNIPLQLEQLFLQPQKYARIEKTKRAVTSIGLKKEELPSDEDIPQWIQDSSPVPLRRLPDGRMEFFLLRNWLPATDIDDFLSVESAFAMGVGMLRPELQLGLETAIGRDVFTGQELKGQREFLGFRMDAKLVNVLRTVRLLTVLDNLDPLGLTRRERKSAPLGSRVTALMTGLKPTVVSLERERYRKLQERREQLSRRHGQLVAQSRRDAQKAATE